MWQFKPAVRLQFPVFLREGRSTTVAGSHSVSISFPAVRRCLAVRVKHAARICDLLALFHE
eukprot:9122425-Alexandrium_andersonii.AAC.1